MVEFPTSPVKLQNIRMKTGVEGILQFTSSQDCKGDICKPQNRNRTAATFPWKSSPPRIIKSRHIVHQVC